MYPTYYSQLPSNPIWFPPMTPAPAVYHKQDPDPRQEEEAVKILYEMAKKVFKQAAFPTEQKFCKKCGTSSTSLWRRGPGDSTEKSFCNACAIRMKRKSLGKANGRISKKNSPARKFKKLDYTTAPSLGLEPV